MTRRFVLLGGLAMLAAVATMRVSVHAGGQYSAKPRAAQIPTFSKDVAPILYANCTGCHRPGEIAPMSLLTYEEARPWYRAIRENVEDGVMPPWHADPKHGRFANDRSLSATDRDTIVRWARGGAPEGDPKDLPPMPAYPEGWTIGTPDLILSMPQPYTVPAEGFVEYEYIEVPTTLTEDKWIQSLEVRPGNRAVVHHVIVYARSPQPERRPTGFRLAEGMNIPAGQTGGPPETGPDKRARGLSRFPAPRRLGVSIGGFAPGNATLSFPQGAAMLLRAGTTLVLQMHYTTSGKTEVDQTKVGFIFAKQPPTTEMRFASMSNGSFVIPAGAADHAVTAEMTATTDVTLRQLLPHTHLRGKSWEYTAIYADGRSDVILSVPKYDFNWQTDYVFAEPLRLPRGTKIRAVAHYDNSPNNPSNPDPTIDVRWGDQTWEEMMFTAFVYSIDGVAPGTVVTAPASSGRQ
jgi:hypothetical protein